MFMLVCVRARACLCVYFEGVECGRSRCLPIVGISFIKIMVQFVFHVRVQVSVSTREFSTGLARPGMMAVITGASVWTR